MGEELECGRRCLLQHSLCQNGATCTRISRGSILNPRLHISDPDALILNLEHVPSMIRRHPCYGPCQTYKPGQALLQPWTSIHPVLFDQHVGPFPEARPGAKAGFLLGSEPMGDRSYAQQPSEECTIYSGLRCISECSESQALQQPCAWAGNHPGPCVPRYSSPSLEMCPPHFLPNLVKRGSK